MPNESHDRILVTAALPYANGNIHLGHLAGAYLPADLYCRYQRLKGEDVLFICGSDEMGVAILMRALREDRTAQDIVDHYHPMIKESFERFGMSFDYYGRTSSDVHAVTSQDFFRRLDEKEVFNVKTNEQLFDPKAEMFLADRFVVGTCPVCGFEEAYGDQCEKCGSSLSPTELIDPKSTLTDATPVLKETSHWYIPLGDMQPELEEWIGTHPEWKNNVLGQVQSWFNDGLKDRSITRDVPWGVPVPEDVAARHGLEAEGKVIYVWFDAPIGYISATKEWALEQNDADRWKTYWQDEDTKLVHFIGKDNIVFHCLMFPAMLKAHGDFVLPDNVPANEFLNLEGRKLSTSRGWAVWLHEYLDDFAEHTHSADMLRYALGTTLPETKDADFSWDGFQSRVNGELADVLGNFVNRTLTFAERFFDGEVPPLEQPTAADNELLEALHEAPGKIGEAYESYRMREAIYETIDLARTGNKYFNDTEPWHTRKEEGNPAAGNTVHVCLQLCASLSVLMEPVLPEAAERLRGMLNLTGVRPSTPTDPSHNQNADDLIGWDDARHPLLAPGHTLGTPDILFDKIEDDTMDAQRNKLGQTDTAAPDTATPEATEADGDSDTDASADAGYTPVKDEIEFGDFMDLDLRTGIVEVAEPVEDADKLLRLEIDLGFEKRQILAGVAEFMTPEEITGQRVVVVANLAPKSMFGLESQGMVLMAEDRDGNLVPVSADAEPGSVVR